MKTYSVLITVDASITVEVEAENEEQAKSLAMEKTPNPSICHHCSREIEIGDLLEAVEAIELTR